MALYLEEINVKYNDGYEIANRKAANWIFLSTEDENRRMDGRTGG
jgi:hypothetical protein